MFLYRWRQPYLANDPHEWTDSTGTIRRDIQSIELKSDKWEWLGPWDVDMDTLIGEGLDKDGWEYASTNFASFSTARKRRCSNALDCVRRRKWLRTRIPTVGSVDERFRPLLVFWDVQILQSGTKNVTVRSNLQVHNRMPYAIMIKLGGSRQKDNDIENGDKNEFGPINPDEIFNIPLLQASASWLQIHPSDFPYSWSQKISCCLQTHDFITMRDIHCEGDTVDKNDIINPVCMRILCEQKSKSLSIIIAPVVIITNRLPCNLQYTCNSSNTKRDEGRINSGSSCKLTSVDLAFSPKISFCIGNYTWTEPKDIDPLSLDPISLDVFTSDGSVGAVLTVLISVNSNIGTVDVCVYSKGLLCDRTSGLGVSLSLRKGRLTNGVDTIRRSFISTDGEIASTRIPTTPIEKQKRFVQLKSDEKIAQKAFNKSLLLPTDDSVLVAWGASPTIVISAESICADSKDDGKDAVERPLENINITNLTVHSVHTYEIVRVNMGDFVYTDRALRWGYLPPPLRGQLSIRTACADEMTRSKHFIRFTVDGPCLILLLVDMRAINPLKWLIDDGFIKISDQAIGRVALSGIIYETSYSIYGKYFQEGEVVLEGNCSKEIHSMYGIFIIPIPNDMVHSLQKGVNDKEKEDSEKQILKLKSCELLDSQFTNTEGLRKIFDEIVFNELYKSSDCDKCWIEGGNGLSLFDSEDKLISVSVKVSYYFV